MEEDWTGVKDMSERKKIQNRLAQRKHRRKIQKQAQSSRDITMPRAHPSISGLTPDDQSHPPYSLDSSNNTGSAILGGGAQSFYDIEEAGVMNWSPVTNASTPPDPMGSLWSEDNDIIGTQDNDQENSGPPKFLEPWIDRNPASLPIRQGLNGQRMNEQPHFDRVPAEAYQLPMWAMAQPENSHWQHRQSLGRSSLSHYRALPSQVSEQLSNTSQCSECGGQQRRRGLSLDISAPTTNTSRILSSPASGTMGSDGNVSDTRQNSEFELLREHGIDLERIISSTGSMRQSSTAPSHLLQHRGSNRQTPERITNHNSGLHRGPSRPEVLEIEPDGFNERGARSPDPRITKVVVVYLQETPANYETHSLPVRQKLV
ncbi:hypothetical protein F5X99DRAFT_107416 [Biscogniauxia marginata]|nr:hypothetical protein F5X99DRAFT_107416 [Biscogniauxia marginata]